MEDALYTFKDELLASYEQGMPESHIQEALWSTAPTYDAYLTSVESHLFQCEYAMREARKAEKSIPKQLQDESEKWKRLNCLLKDEKRSYLEEVKSYGHLAQEVMKKHAHLGIPLLAITPVSYWGIL
jgi:hypothetical protein